ncbi:ABC transporter [Thecamonas trahens ATCC 50062]|uniref:ABC transporter n=1 Tax=Thecamonas trahens ATCC 50062 TaxID=461836 RepID=A0A0L0DMR1_THETB|nr:ABC transporter [Thecamonas trahens ATCC 50062]KNC53584.1 ABC transporter [Thecamonas trahens ATCC 50062]|eukprot:XP_013761901.1 ABC transporter [Thecamonas trahens ATCC 50062]
MQFEIASYEVNGRSILQSVAGEVAPGSVLGVMGPSGAGKSTFLTVVGERLPGVSGARLDARVQYGGMAYSKHVASRLAFCPQDDAALIPCLTVRETLETQGALRLPVGAVLSEAVDAVLADLGLEHVADSRIGSAFERGISGGERRRVSVACELLSRPKYLLLDEPTSGLDSASAERLMADVAGLAARDGVVVMCSIHQPSRAIVGLLDSLLVLVGGRMAYMGPRSRLQEALVSGGLAPAGANVAEEVLRVVVSPGGCDLLDVAVAGSGEEEVGGGSGTRRRAATGRVLVTSSGKRRLTTSYGDDEPVFGARSLSKMKVLFWRQALVVKRDPHVFSVRAVMIWLMALMIGGLYFEIASDYETVRDLVNVFFFAVLVTTFVSLTTLPHAVHDRLILRHEYRSRLYSVAAHVSTTLIFRSAVILIIVGVFYAVLVGRFFAGLAVLVVANIFAELFMLVMGLVSPDPVIAISVGVTLYGFFMLTSGAIINPSRAPAVLRPMFFSSFYRPAIQALMLITFPDMAFECPTVLAQVIPDYAACRVAGQDVLRTVFRSGDTYFISSVGAGVSLLLGLIAVWIVLYALLLHAVLSGTDFGLLRLWERVRGRKYAALSRMEAPLIGGSVLHSNE